MPDIELVNKWTPEESFRAAAVRGTFDFEDAEVEHRIECEFPIDEKPWKIGAIIGASGSGKTTVARDQFESDLVDFDKMRWHGSKSFIDSYPKGLKIEDITAALSSVGLSSPPDWLKPYRLLSNGQKFRAAMARSLLSKKGGTLVVDEFTSVVDRQVAKACCVALNKHLNRKDDAPRFVAVSCHHDIVEFLRPDWVLDLDEKRFTWCGRIPKPSFRIVIRPAEKSVWGYFRRHHYLSHTLASSCKCFVAFMIGEDGQETPVAFTSYLRQPHARAKNIMREHRTVVLPDYQGLGLGVRLADWLANKLVTNGWRFTSVTSHPAMIAYRQRSENWVCRREASHTSSGSAHAKIHNNSGSQRRLTYSFEYKL